MDDGLHLAEKEEVSLILSRSHQTMGLEGEAESSEQQSAMPSLGCPAGRAASYSRTLVHPGVVAREVSLIQGHEMVTAQIGQIVEWHSPPW